MAGETIFALSSGGLPSAIAITRLSGPLSRSVFEAITESAPKPRQLVFRDLVGADGVVFDQAMAVFFQGPASATGEDCVEFHNHGGRAIVVALFAALQALGCRPAEPGEFTKRAFLNGKLDLVQAEAVADLIAADTEAQRRFAATVLGGSASTLYASWRSRLLHARAMIEAELDFADEGDVPGSVADEVWQDMTALTDEITSHIGRFAQAEILRNGFEIVILGAPNAGKSSLLNALAQRDVAIVSDIAGTTRDLIEVQLDFEGIKVRLVDTAGLRATTNDSIERIGMGRARLRAREANLVLLLVDVSDPVGVDDLPGNVGCITVGSKADLVQVATAFRYDLEVSAKSGLGISDLIHLLGERARVAAGTGDETMPSRERHVAHLRQATQHLRTALTPALPLELRAEELRLAGSALGHITGEIGTEEVLGTIFSRFCIGK